MKEQVKGLWKRCFDDSEEFIEMYFNLRYTDERNIALRNEGQVVSALQMIPYPMTFCGDTVPTSYISGACTHPDFRGKGVMRDLLTQTFQSMQKRGILFSTLIPAEPWLFSYYERMGYASVFEYSSKEVMTSDYIASTDIFIATITEYKKSVYQYLNRKLAQRSCCIQHTPEDFKVIMADLALSDGYLLVAEKDHLTQGIAILYRKDGYTEINELFAENEEIERSLLSYIHQKICSDRLIRLLPAGKTSQNQPLGMARIINAQKVLKLYAAAFPEKEMQIELSDEQIPINNGYYDLYKGNCTYTPSPSSYKHIPMNAIELTKKIFVPIKPYMSLMLN